MTCTTGKTCHATQHKAIAELRKLTGGNVYRCDRCNCWHVSSQRDHKNRDTMQVFKRKKARLAEAFKVLPE